VTLEGPPEEAAVIRRARPDDLAAMGVLGALLIDLHHGWDERRFIGSGPQTGTAYATFLGRELERTEAVLLVAERAGGIVGYAYAALEGHDYMSLRGPAGVIHDLVVTPESRRQGIGLRLLTEARDILSRRGAPLIVLSTAERNLTAQKLFGRLGFRRTMIEMACEPTG
jgi:ribosomal protein S18 acetylase RimI-like enzyme